jgi:peptidoglycan-associated lipoprotein
MRTKSCVFSVFLVTVSVLLVGCEQLSRGYHPGIGAAGLGVAGIGGSSAGGQGDMPGDQREQGVVAGGGGGNRTRVTAGGEDLRPDLSQFRSVAALRDIHFDFDSYTVKLEASAILAADADWILSNPDRLVLIEGHCDERGTNQYNLALGEHRGKAALNYLIAHGVSADRLITLSYGEERPFCTTRTEACWARNRRVHFLAGRARPAERASLRLWREFMSGDRLPPTTR